MNRTTAHLRSNRLSGNWVAVYRDTRLRHDLHGAVPGGFEPGGPLATFGNEPNDAPEPDDRCLAELDRIPSLDRLTMVAPAQP